jgi:hypothetical protein
MREGTMKKQATVLLLLLALLGSSRAAGQDVANSTPGRTAAAPGRLFKPVVIRCKDGSFKTGLLFGLEGDALVLRSGKKEEIVALRDMLQATFDRPKETADYLANGMVLGFFGTRLAAWRPSEQPAPFMETDGVSVLGMGFSILISAAMGGGLGYLSSLMFDKDKVAFDLSDQDDARRSGWDRLRQYVLDAPEVRPKRWELAIGSGLIFPGATKRYKDVILNSGYTIYGDSGNGYNMFRRVGLSRTIGGRFAVGVSVAVLGEEEIFGTRSDSQSWGSIEQKLSGAGYYVTGSWEPLRTKLPADLRWKIGLGAGAARMTFEVSGQGSSRSSSWSGGLNVSRTLPSLLAFGELDLRIRGGLFLGIMADRTFMPSFEVPALVEARLNSRKMPFENGSAGIGFGWMF